jgi:hypothetical protein
MLHGLVAVVQRRHGRRSGSGSSGRSSSSAGCTGTAGSGDAGCNWDARTLAEQVQTAGWRMKTKQDGRNSSELQQLQQ